MSSSNDGKNSNDTITLKSFAELANVLDLESLPSGPPDVDDNADGTDNTDSALGSTSASTQSDAVAEEQPSTATPRTWPA